MYIIIADDGLPFDGRDVVNRPMGGAESCVAWLAEAFAHRGHDIHCYTRCREKIVFRGVAWHPLEKGVPHVADLFIANRGNKVLPLVPKAKAMAFWVHNPACYLNKPRYWWPLLRRRPTSVFLSHFHASTASTLLPTRRTIIPHGVHPAFTAGPVPFAAPPPKAVFLSNPLRGLDLTLDLWTARVLPRVPDAELHLYFGSALMSERETKHPKIEVLIKRAMTMPSVHLHNPVSRDRLAEELRDFRLALYPATVDESYCLAVAELQALGIPAVVSSRGALPERVVDGRTGNVCSLNDEDKMADHVITLLRDDEVWLRMRRELGKQSVRRWEDVAADFERLENRSF